MKSAMNTYFFRTSNMKLHDRLRDSCLSTKPTLMASED